MTDGPTPTHDLTFLEGGGEMGALIRSHDWSTSPLGHPATWPQSLRSALGMVLASPFPMMLAWGRELITLHNDAYLPFLGDKPRATGRSLLDVWAEVRDTIAPLFERALAGEACRFADVPFTILRRGKPEEAFFDFSLSPVRDDAGAVAGVLNVAVETTERTRTAAGRACAEAELRAHAARQTFRLKFEERLRDLADPDMIKTEAVALLGEHLGTDRVGYSEIVDDRIVRTRGSYAANGMTPLNGDFPIESFGEAMIARQR